VLLSSDIFLVSYYRAYRLAADTVLFCQAVLGSLAGGIPHPYLFRLPVGQFGVHAFLAVIPFEATRYGMFHIPLVRTHFQVIRTVVVAVPVDMVQIFLA
jgi:hypothetical protein